MDPRFAIRSDYQTLQQADASLNFYTKSLVLSLNKLRHVFDHKGNLKFEKNFFIIIIISSVLHLDKIII